MAEAKQITILEVEFPVSMPFDEGHVCTAAEARALNQTRRENLGNNIRAEVKKYTEQAEGAMTLEELQAEFAKRDGEYVFTLANSGPAAAKLDSVEREARSIARSLLKDAFGAAGAKLTVVPSAEVLASFGITDALTEEQWSDIVEAKLTEVAGKDEVVAAAKKAVKARQGATAITLEGLGVPAPVAA